MAPVAVSVEELPKQIIAGEAAIVMVGLLLTVTVAIAVFDAKHPNALVPVTL